MTDEAFAQADPDWLALISAAREWLSGPVGQFLLEEERHMLEDELGRFFGGYLVHYGPSAQNAAVGTASPAQRAPGSAVARGGNRL